MLLADMPAAEDCSAGASSPAKRVGCSIACSPAIGRDRGSIYLAFAVLSASPDGRWSGEASGRCAALARHHIGLVAPRVLLLLGDAPAKALIGMGMAQGRGRWHDIQTHAGPVKALVTLPPDLLLKQPGLKAHAWADLQMLMQGPS
jgi:DNA polymerase